MATQFIPPGGLPAGTPVGTDGDTLSTIKDTASLANTAVQKDGGDASATMFGWGTKTLKSAMTNFPTGNMGNANARLLASAMQLSSGATTSNGTVPYTFGVNFALAARFYGVKLILANYGTTTNTVAAISVATSASSADQGKAVNADGTAATWFPVSVGGVSSNIVLPAAPNVSRPSYTLSDMIPIQSVDRTDGGAGHLIYTRCLSQTATWFSGVLRPLGGNGGAGGAALPNGVSDMNPGLGDWPIQSFYSTGDSVTSGNTNAITSYALANATTFIVVGAVFYSLEQCITLAGAGDSLWQGYLANGSWSGFGRQAAQQLNTAGIKTSYCDLGWSGQIGSKIRDRVKDFLALGIAPHVFGIACDSPNDFIYTSSGTSTDALNEAYSVSPLLEAMNMATRAGSFVFTTTPLPWYSPEAYPAARYPTADILREYNPIGVGSVLDAEEILCGSIPTVASPGSVPSAYQATDGHHYSAAGQALLATNLVPYVQSVAESIFEYKGNRSNLAI